MKDSYKEICDILKMDERFLSSEGILLKNKIIEYVNKMDEQLISLLYKNEFTKSMFFVMVDGIAVFDKTKFNWVVESEDFLPDSYTKFKNNILLVDENRRSIKNSGDVVLEFPYKDCVLEMDSTSDKEVRKEVFLNETIMKSDIDVLLDPKCFCVATKHELNANNQLTGKTITEFKETENLIINGNNLLALCSLLPRYKGQIKFMYWDILYNTDSDQVPYNDSFKHSSWLVMMKNRLEIAQKLLKEEGVICLQCDYNEQAYLKILCDEIFGRENYVSMITVKTSSESGVKVNANKPVKVSEYLLIYSKNKNLMQYTHIKIPTTYDKNYNQYILNPEDNFSKWKITNIKDVAAKEYNKNKKDLTDDELKLFQIQNKNRVFSVRDINKNLKSYIKENKIDKNIVCEYITSTGKRTLLYKNGEIVFVKNKVAVINGKEELTKIASDIWIDIAWDGIANEGNVVLKNGKKPEKLIQRLLEGFTEAGDIVLDAYLGSGTTAAVAHKMGRRYIGIEQLISHYGMAKQRLLNVIEGDSTGISKSVGWDKGGSFVSCRLANDSHNLIIDIEVANHHDNLNALYHILKTSQFALYRLDAEKMDKNEDEFKKLSLDEKKKLLISIIDKNTLYINFSDIDDWHYDMLDEDKEFTKSFYRMED